MNKIKIIYKKIGNKSQSIVISKSFKILVEGYSGVGKTSILQKYLGGKSYKRKQYMYIAYPYFLYTFSFPFEDKNIGIELFDCINKREFGSAAPFICRRTDIFIFVYDISDNATFITIKKNLVLYKDKFEEKNALKIIVGNKNDLKNREVQRNVGENFAKEINAIFIETSALTGEGIDKLFELCINNLIQRFKNGYNLNDNDATNSSITPTPVDSVNNTPFEKPNNNIIDKSKQDNYEKLYHEEKLRNENLEKEITKLQNVNEYLEKELKNEREKNSNNNTIKENTPNEDQNKIIKLYDEISENQKEIKILKGKLERFPFEISENEKLMSVIISTEDKNIQYSIICKNTDKFLRIEEKFYEVFPEHAKSENAFYINGKKINKYKTLEENNVKNSEIIILKKED